MSIKHAPRTQHAYITSHNPYVRRFERHGRSPSNLVREPAAAGRAAPRQLERHCLSPGEAGYQSRGRHLIISLPAQPSPSYCARDAPVSRERRGIAKRTSVPPAKGTSVPPIPLCSQALAYIGRGVGKLPPLLPDTSTASRQGTRPRRPNPQHGPGYRRVMVLPPRASASFAGGRAALHS